MKNVEAVGGQELREMFAAATAWLEKSVPEIDALNVFPVPDGDTGTNMLLTMRSTVEEAYRAPDHSAAAVSDAMAKGALMGARGNSGVILSQIWRGLAEGLTKKDQFTGRDFAEAFCKAADTAYLGLSNPVEGTILTVIKDASEAGLGTARDNNGNLVEVMESIVGAAGESVADTPKLLPVLKEAGVVDAGGQGLYTIMEGALRYLKGETEQLQFRKPQMIVSNIAVPTRINQIIADEEPYGYCTEFLLKGEKLNTDKLKARLNRKGQSLIVVGDKNTVRVHIHTLDPGQIIHYAASLGTLHQINIRNMDEQHEDYLEIQKQKTPASEIAVVAVVPGDGLKDVFLSLGAVVVSGGQTMNPSTKDILHGVEAVASEKVIILPNNKNIIMTASQVQSLTRKSIKIIPTKTIPQGVAALLAFDYEANFDSNSDIMNKASSTVKSIEITRSIRTTKINGMRIRRKQPIGLLDDELVAVGEDAVDVLNQVLCKLNLDEYEVFTIYYGGDTEQVEAEEFAGTIRDQHPNLQIEVVRGGQPHYDYIISVE